MLKQINLNVNNASEARNRGDWCKACIANVSVRGFGTTITTTTLFYHFLFWNPSKMKGPSLNFIRLLRVVIIPLRGENDSKQSDEFQARKGLAFYKLMVYIIEKKKYFIYCIEISEDRGLKVTLSKSFSLTWLWRLQWKMKCNLFSILLDEQCWHILTFWGKIFWGHSVSTRCSREVWEKTGQRTPS